jgi:hypothetical protein
MDRYRYFDQIPGWVDWELKKRERLAALLHGLLTDAASQADEELLTYPQHHAPFSGERALDGVFSVNRKHTLADYMIAQTRQQELSAAFPATVWSAHFLSTYVFAEHAAVALYFELTIRYGDLPSFVVRNTGLKQAHNYLKNAYKRAGVEITGAGSAWGDIERYKELRDAVAHDAGRLLTLDGEQKNRSVLKMLARHGVTVTDSGYAELTNAFCVATIATFQTYFDRLFDATVVYLEVRGRQS